MGLSRGKPWDNKQCCSVFTCVSASEDVISIYFDLLLESHLHLQVSENCYDTDLIFPHWLQYFYLLSIGRNDYIKCKTVEK